MVYNAKMAYGIIYHWQCVKTNMGYVGQTTNTLNGRWKGHRYNALRPESKAGQWEFPKAIREHGESSFVGRIICECETPEELDSAEQRSIVEFNTMWPNGYNMLPGGSGKDVQTRHLISERTREGMTKLDHTWKNRQRLAMLDPEVRRKISERTADAMKRPEVKAKLDAFTDDPEYRRRMSEKLMGHSVSEETRRKIREKRALQTMPKKPKPTVLCHQCRVVFTARKNDQRFCSQKCYRGH